LPTGWILLDSGSTTDIISDQDLLHNIHPAANPIWISSIAGCIKLTKKGHLGTYPHPVWYNPKGIVNILSLYNVSAFYQVTMDTMHSKTMKFHVKDNSTINFAPTENGLWVHHVDNPQTVQDMWSMLSTVSSKKELYTKGAAAIMQELGQLTLMDVISRCSPGQLTKQQKQKGSMISNVS
jgi:hypothetical protein